MDTDLIKIINQLKKLESEFQDSFFRSYKADNNNLYSIDFLANTVNNRALSITKAYITLINDNNFLAGISLIRLQLDNALRFFAATLVGNLNDFMRHFLDGKEIRDYKDVFGRKLTDNYLAKEIDKYFKGTYQLYKESCGYIHLSDQHFFPIMTKNETKDKSFKIIIGKFDNFTIEQKITFSKTMLEVSKLVIIILEQWKHEKINLSKSRK